MKKLLSTVVISVTVLLFSCTDEDPNTADAKACFTYSPANINVGDEVTFSNCSENASDFGWDFGDGGLSVEENPVYTFERPGEFVVRLVSTNESSVDEVSQTLVVTGDLITINRWKFEEKWEGTWGKCAHYNY